MLIRHFICHMLAFAIYNKNNVGCRKILNNKEFFADTVHTKKEDNVKHRKRKCLMDPINKKKVYLLAGKNSEHKV